MSEMDLSIERLSEFSEADATGIGRLMPFLSERLSGDPIDTKVLKTIISSPYHEQLVAKLDGRIVGAATMDLLMGPGMIKEGYLEDFVTDPAVRGRGIGDKVWQEMLAWCRENGVDLSFTSKPSRELAHRFYKNHGADERNTTVYKVLVN
ncbi:MAG TPA: GNAT family N-acetyltransferase [Candidatus Saccharimonadales bacterium]|nr:GNAT family N-acetyltransferase [Candidatus Saccharimonadales bacterium]